MFRIVGAEILHEFGHGFDALGGKVQVPPIAIARFLRLADEAGHGRFDPDDRGRKGTGFLNVGAGCLILVSHGDPLAPFFDD